MRVVLRALVVAATVAAPLFLLVPRAAEACSCARPGIALSPGPREVAPRNARVRLAVPADRGWIARNGVNAADVVVRLRAGKIDVPFARTDFGAGDLHFIELRPRALLAPKTRYGVYVEPPAGKEALVGEFRTGDHTDGSPPSWNGVLRAVYYHTPAVCCDCSTGDPYAVVALSSVRDDSTSDDALTYGVWLGDSRGRLDYTRPPHTIATDWGGHLSLGHQSACSPANLRFPPGARTVRLGIRALDLAGNASPPSELVLDLTRPVRTKRSAK